MQDRDLQRWVPAFVEGLMMTYLSSYTRECTIWWDSMWAPPVSIDLNEEIRKGLLLPSQASASLNLVWPLVQGIQGGMTAAVICGNKRTGLSRPRYCQTSQLSPLGPAYSAPEQEVPDVANLRAGQLK